jgi:glycosyltransferase involved in cell wall biosynthesis
MRRRRKVLLSAYACEPDLGSEPGIGWNWVRQAARFHEVWVITRASNRAAIERGLQRDPLPHARFYYFDLPGWARFWKKGRRGVHVYYYLWQVGAWGLARRLHRAVRFDAAHHVTLGTYWFPSFLALLPVPFLWGPVGGGESGPRSFRRRLHLRGRVYETARDLARWVCRLDPLVRRTARRARLVLAATPETRARLLGLGCRNVVLLPPAALPGEETVQFEELTPPAFPPFRVAGIGELVHWKGFGLGLEAFARLHQRYASSEYWIIGDGPDRTVLEQTARRLGIRDCVRFWGRLDRAATLARLAACHILLHPSWHDSGGWVCLEAMAAGRPVVCLDLGGPALLVSEETGIKTPARSPEQAVEDLAAALERLASDRRLCARMGAAGRQRVAARFTWEDKGELERVLCSALAA